MKPSAEDEAWLDELFGEIVAALSDGRPPPGAADLPPSRAHLAGDVNRLLAMASRVAQRRPSEFPSVPGFAIERLLGQGGMGRVYLARDERLGRRVALKVLPFRGSSQRSRERFNREARAVARLEHPLIVPIHGMGEDAGHLWFSMQHVEGRTLAQIASDARSEGTAAELLQGSDFARLAGAAGELPPDWRRDWVRAAVRSAADVADALAYAHTQGVVHRDVKPSNVMVRRDGFSLLFDFGLADVADETTLTLTRGFLGTPHYASPEQAAGAVASLDGRTDVWSLAATLHEMLTFSPPFTGPSAHELLRRIQAWDPESPSRANPAVPPALDAIVRRGLAKERSDRYATAAEMAADLRAFLEGRDVTARGEGILSRGLRLVRRNRALTELLVEQRTRNAELRDLLRQAEDARAEAERQRDRATQVAGFLGSVLSSADPGSGSKDVRVADLLSDVVRRAGVEFEGDAAMRAELLATVAGLLMDLGRNAEAHEAATRASDAAREAGEPGSRAAIEADTVLAMALPSDYDASLKLLRSAWERSRSAFGDGDELTVRAITSLGLATFMRDRSPDAIPILRQAASVAEALGPRGADLRLRAERELGTVLIAFPATRDEGIERLERLAKYAAASKGESSAVTVRIAAVHAIALIQAGRCETAVPILRRAVDALVALYGDSHPIPAQNRLWLGHALVRLRRVDEGIRELERADREFVEAGLGESVMRLGFLRQLRTAYDAGGRGEDSRRAAAIAADIEARAPERTGEATRPGVSSASGSPRSAKSAERGPGQT